MSNLEKFSDEELRKVVSTDAALSDDQALESFIAACINGTFVEAQLAVLEIADATGVSMKICSAVEFALNTIVLNGKKNAKVWGSTSGWNLVKKLKSEVDRDVAIPLLAELNSRLVDFRLQAGAFAVNEKLALSSLAWKFIKVRDKIR